jgi:hypothetical protein
MKSSFSFRPTVCATIPAITLWCVALVGCADANLTQQDLTSLPKLVQQREAATAKERNEAADWTKRAQEAEKQQRWDLASKMHGEALLLYPSFRSLRARGESIARSDRKRNSKAESISAQKKAFESAAESLNLAIGFAESRQGEATAKEIDAIRMQIVCLESYLKNDKVDCELTASVIGRYASQK